MSPYRQRLLHNLSTFVTFLRCEARIDSSHTMPGSFSLVTEDGEKCAPTGVHDALSEMVIFHHVGDLKVFNGNPLIAFGVRFSCLEMVIAALPIDLQVRLSHVLRGFTASVRAFLTSTQLALFASQGSLRAAIEAGIVNRVAFTISQERFQSNIKTDVRMLTGGGEMLSLRNCLADDQSVPVSISTQDQMDCFGFALYRAVQLDFDGLPHLGRNDELFLILVQVDIFTILPELDGVPLVALLEARETSFHGKLFACKKTLERFGEAICKTLYGCGRDMLSTTSFETSGEIILTRECTLFFILCFDRLKHLVIDMPGLAQALHEQVRLFFMWVQAVFKRSHRRILLSSLERVKFPSADGRQFTPMSKARCTLAAYW